MKMGTGGNIKERTIHTFSVYKQVEKYFGNQALIYRSPYHLVNCGIYTLCNTHS